jgi:hypothetical protein
MMGREFARNMLSFVTEQIWIISAAGWLLKKKSVTDIALKFSLRLKKTI